MLVALLARFYEPSGGTITLSERRCTASPAVLRARIGYVEQDAPVLAGTLRENLLYALPGASEQALAAVIEEARLAETLVRLPDNLETEIGDRGRTLSGGGVSGSRSTASCCVVPTCCCSTSRRRSSTLPTTSTLCVTRSSARPSAGAVLVIAHRLSTVVAADQIVVLDRGRVRAIGSSCRADRR